MRCLTVLCHSTLTTTTDNSSVGTATSAVHEEPTASPQFAGELVRFLWCDQCDRRGDRLQLGNVSRRLSGTAGDTLSTFLVLNWPS